MNAMAKTGKRLDAVETFKGRIEAGGFTNIHEKLYKLPVGEWRVDKTFLCLERLEDSTRSILRRIGRLCYVCTSYLNIPTFAHVLPVSTHQIRRSRAM